MEKYINSEWLEEFVGGKLKTHNMVFKAKLTVGDIVLGKYYDYYKQNKNPKLTISGLYVPKYELASVDEKNEMLDEYIKDNELELRYVELDEIKSDEKLYSLLPVNDSVKLIIVGTFSIIRKCCNNIYEILERVVCDVNPTISTDNAHFSVNSRSKEVIATENKTNSELFATIKCKYFFNNKKYECSTSVKQECNIISDWVLDSEKTNNLKLKLSNEHVNHYGGTVIARVYRDYTDVLVKKDSLGNIVETKKIKTFDEEVSSLSTISVTNTNGFSVRHGKIIVDPQEINGKARYTTVSAKYDGFTSFLTINQDCGLKSSSKLVLKFADESLHEVNEVDNKGKSDFYIPIISQIVEMIGDKEVSVIDNTNISFDGETSWCKATLLTNNMFVKISILSSNNDINSERNTTISVNDGKNKILIPVKQVRNKVVSVKKYLYIASKHEYRNAELENEKITVIPYTESYYSNLDRTIETKLIDGNNIICHCNSTDNLFNVSKLQSDGYNYFVTLGNTKEAECKDYDVELTFDFVDKNGEKLCDSLTEKLLIHGKEIVTTTNELSFADGTKYKELVWEDTNLKQIEVGIKSIEDVYLNGEYNNSNEKKYNYYIIDEDYSYFNIEKLADKILITPIEGREINETIEKKLVIYQDNGLQLNISLIILHKEEQIGSKINVTIHKEGKTSDIWTTSGVLKITDCKTNEIKTLELTKGWVSPSEGVNYDDICNNEVCLTVGRDYTFTTNGVISHDIKGNTKDVNISKKLDISSNNKIIKLIIEL